LFVHKKCLSLKKGLDEIDMKEMKVIFLQYRIDWEILLQEVVGPTHVLFHSNHFGTLSLCIFLRRDLIWFCTGTDRISNYLNLSFFLLQNLNKILLNFARWDLFVQKVLKV
jgi:hypothetical protein